MNEENNTEKEGFLKKIFKDVSENVSEGAAFITKKVTEGAAVVGEKVVETSAKAYVAGSEIVSDASEKIHDFTEKQQLQKTEKQLLSRQEEIVAAFGENALTHYIENDSLHKAFLTTKVIADLVDEYKTNELKIKGIKEEIVKIENH